MKNEKYSLLVVGGDARQGALAAELFGRGHSVFCCGLDRYNGFEDPGPEVVCDLPLALRRCDAVILPIPVSENFRDVFAPLTADVFPLAGIFSIASTRLPIIGGRFTDTMRELLEGRGYPVFDYARDESFQLLNAVLTAEAAVGTAIEQTPFALFESRVLVCGYGRIGRVLCRRLQALGAVVSVAARRNLSLVCARADGYEGFPVAELPEQMPQFDLVFNTAPAMIFDRYVLEKSARGVYLIDLASLPGGVDYAVCEELGIHAVHALSLPGKYSPQTAAGVTAQVIETALQSL